MCQAGTWSVSEKVYELREFTGGGLVIGASPIVPVIPIACTNCGNTIFVNALIVGAIQQPKKEDA